MTAEQLLQTVEPVLENIAKKYAIRNNPQLGADDLLQEQRLKVLEIYQNPPCQGQALIHYTLKACRMSCLQLVRDNWRKSGRKVPVSLDQEVIAEFISDGTYEKLRQKLEERARLNLLQALLQSLDCPRDRRIVQEILDPRPQTLEILRSGGTIKQALAKSTGVPFHAVRRSLTTIRKTLQAAA